MWQALSARDAERLTLVWETQELLALNFSIVSFLKDQVSSMLHVASYRLGLLTGLASLACQPCRGPSALPRGACPECRSSYNCLWRTVTRLFVMHLCDMPGLLPFNRPLSQNLQSEALLFGRPHSSSSPSLRPCA